MKAASSQLDRLGLAIQAALDAHDNHPQLVLKARRRLLSQFIRRGAVRRWVWRPTQGTLRWFAVGAALGCSALATALWAWWGQAITFRVVGASTDVEVQLGDVIATGDQGAGVFFSEGTVLGVAPRSNARVLSVEPERVRVLLESGELRAKLEDSEATRWDFEAGPFRAMTRGSVLHLEWSPARGVLTLSSNGSAQVSAACLGAVREIDAGHSTQITCPVEAFAAAEAQCFDPESRR